MRLYAFSFLWILIVTFCFKSIAHKTHKQTYFNLRKESRPLPKNIQFVCQSSYSRDGLSTMNGARFFSVSHLPCRKNTIKWNTVQSQTKNREYTDNKYIRDLHLGHPREQPQTSNSRSSITVLMKHLWRIIADQDKIRAQVVLTGSHPSVSCDSTRRLQLQGFVMLMRKAHWDSRHLPPQFLEPRATSTLPHSSRAVLCQMDGSEQRPRIAPSNEHGEKHTPYIYTPSVSFYLMS